MSLMSQEEEFHPIIKQAFSNEKLTGYDIACNSEMADLIRRDSSQFATGVINHPRGRSIICQLVDVALRPRVLISYLSSKQQSQQLHSIPFTQKHQTNFLTQSSAQITTIVYNAIQILTNQYQQFVQFVFGQNDDNKSEFVKQDKIVNQRIKKEDDVNRMEQLIEEGFDNDDDFEDSEGGRESWGCEQQVQKQQQNWQKNGVIIDSGYPELTRNQQDELLQKIIIKDKISPNQTYKSSFLDRMFLLFQQPIPIQQTPVSYFNKIMLQFVYQKPQQIMRYFYCDYFFQKGKTTKIKKSNTIILENNNNNNKKKNENNNISKSKKLNVNMNMNKNNTINCSSLTSSSGSLRTPRIRLIVRHLYNNSVIQLLGHLMQLQSDGNFFSLEKIEILKSITQQVFPTIKITPTKSSLPSELNNVYNNSTTTEIDLNQDRINNFVLFLRQMYEKLQDRYEQQKFLSVFKYFVNDSNVIRRVVDYYYNLQMKSGGLQVNGIMPLLTQILKFDRLNFIKHKSQLPSSSSPFGSGTDHFSMRNSSQKQDSSIASYDIKLSNEVMNQLENIILILISQNNKQQHQCSTIKMVEFYDLLYNWLNVIVTNRQDVVMKKIITPGFVDDCIGKMLKYQRASILHNAIKNILVDFLPKLNNALDIILASSQCHLLSFIENYLIVDKNENSQGKKGKRKVKCFQNQLFHIGKAVISIWEQQKSLNLNKKTEESEQDSLQNTQSPLDDKQLQLRFERLKQMIRKKEQFYNYLICGDPRKMGQYQQDQSSQIIIASSSLKNYFKQPKSQHGSENDNNNGEIMINTKGSQKSSKDRYSDNLDDEDDQDDVTKKEKSKRKLDIQDLKRDTNLKTDPKFISLRIGVDHNSSLFQSAISPLNAYRSHSFNFETDALPLDSDNSQHMSQQQQQDFRLQENNDNEQKQLQQNIESLDMMDGNFILGMDSNILSNNSISNNQNSSNNNVLLRGDNYRRDQLSKSMDIPDLNMDIIQKVESYNAIESPRLQSMDDILSLGIKSKNNSASKISDEWIDSKLNVNNDGEVRKSFIKEEIKYNAEYESMETQEVKQDRHQSEASLKPFSSYLKYNIDDLCMDLE